MAREQKYELAMTMNDNCEDVHPWFWLFRGRWGALLMAGMFGYVWAFKWCSEIGLDLLSSVLVSVSPLIGCIGYVVVFVNGRPPNYGTDIAKEWLFNANEWLYARGLIDRPPQLWRVNSEPENPLK